MEEKTNLRKKFLVLFWGNFIPLQGIQFIIRVAKKLEKHSDIQFSIIGKGQRYPEIQDLTQQLDITNINFLGRLPHKELPNYIAKANVCLGIFGDTEKTQRVVPNKVYEAIAMKKPVITADTPAARELFTNRKNILFCKTANAQDLAKKILELKNSETLRNSIARGGYEIFKGRATPKIITKKLLKSLVFKF